MHRRAARPYLNVFPRNSCGVLHRCLKNVFGLCVHDELRRVGISTCEHGHGVFSVPIFTSPYCIMIGCVFLRCVRAPDRGHVRQPGARDLGLAQIDGAQTQARGRPRVRRAVGYITTGLACHKIKANRCLQTSVIPARKKNRQNPVPSTSDAFQEYFR